MSLGSRLLERYSTLFYCCCGWTTCDSDSKEASKAQPDVNNTVFHDHHNIFEILVLYRVHITAGTWARIAKAKIQFLVKGKSKDLAICTLFAAGAGSTPGAATFLSSNRQAQPDRDAEECFSPSLSHSSSLPESGGRGRRLAFGSVGVSSED